jgi:hypothetical protein
LRSKPVTDGWLNRLVFSLTGGDKLAVLEFAAVAVVVIALVGALCTFVSFPQGCMKSARHSW